MDNTIQVKEMLEYIKLKDEPDKEDVVVIFSYGNFNEYNVMVLYFMLKILTKEGSTEGFNSFTEYEGSKENTRESIQRNVGKAVYYKKVIEFLEVYVYKLAVRVSNLTKENISQDARETKRELHKVRLLCQYTFKGRNEWVRMNNQLVKKFIIKYLSQFDETHDYRLRLRINYVTSVAGDKYDKSFEDEFQTS